MDQRSARCRKPASAVNTRSTCGRSIRPPPDQARCSSAPLAGRRRPRRRRRSTSSSQVVERVRPRRAFDAGHEQAAARLPVAPAPVDAWAGSTIRRRTRTELQSRLTEPCMRSPPGRCIELAAERGCVCFESADAGRGPAPRRSARRRWRPGDARAQAMQGRRRRARARASGRMRTSVDGGGMEWRGRWREVADLKRDGAKENGLALAATGPDGHLTRGAASMRAARCGSQSDSVGQ